MSSVSFSAAAWAVRIQFFLAGLLFASWGVHVPSVKRHYGLSETGLAIAMLVAGVATVVTLMQAGRIVTRFGSRASARVAGLATAAALAMLLLPSNVMALGALMLLFGFGNSLFDVCVNTSASELEQRSGRSLMSGFHGMFSLGGMAGAAFGAAWLARGGSPLAHLLVATAGAAVGVLLAGARLPDARPQDEAGASHFALPRGPLAALGVLAALALIAEGAMYDWSVLYVGQELGGDAGTAALAYASFSGAMAAARFGGDALRQRVSAGVLMSGSAALAAVAMAVVLLWAQPVPALVGFAIVGFGMANVVPVLFSAAAQADANPARGIAAVAGMGYLGMMAGPPLIGVIAEHASLAVGLASVVVFAAILAWASPRALRRALPAPGRSS